jgi:hypothetical protein
MECGNPNVHGAAARSAEQRGEAVFHYSCGFVGECNGENGLRRNALRDQMRDAIRNDARFAGARSRENQHGALGGEDGLALA